MYCSQEPKDYRKANYPKPAAVVAWKLFAVSRGVSRGRGPVTITLSPHTQLQRLQALPGPGGPPPTSREVPEGSILTWPLPSIPRTS